MPKTMTPLDESLDFLRDQIHNTFSIAEEHYVIFGSASLVMRGILDREPGDIDVFMSRRLWGALLADDKWFWETPKATHPPILSNTTSPVAIHAFFDWSNEFATMDVPYLLNNKEWIKYNGNEYPVVSVEEALRVKEAAGFRGGHKKHIPDIKIIRKWLRDSQN